ncbi:rod shape-determining protein MreD [Lapidilactobacillus mulanensis]|uniref:Rod shape-determining protein MreD n=1 Tax=Lapidilactobacillus mulanensis TaxID=2485999 RepID=A0ABW4DQX8_9LACO|nr:rod shape-determining protein MreD [Lapidilactobacillus mulanensis]
MEDILHRRWIMLILLVLGFFLDGSLSLVFSQFFFVNDLQMAPQILLLEVVLVTFAAPDEPLLFWFTLFCGLFYDLFYTGLIGQYTLIVPLTYLLTKYLLNFFKDRPIYKLAAFIISVLVAQVILYFLALFFGMTSENIGQFIINALAPTILLNVVLFIVLYWPSAKLLGLMYIEHRR